VERRHLWWREPDVELLHRGQYHDDGPQHLGSHTGSDVPGGTAEFQVVSHCVARHRSLGQRGIRSAECRCTDGRRCGYSV